MSVPESEIDTPDAEVFVKGEVRCLTNPEVLLLLERVHEKRIQRNPAHQDPPLIQKVVEYATKFRVVKNFETVRHLRENLLSQYSLSQWEETCLLNLSPESSEEAMKLVPSLQRFMDPETGQMPELDNLLAEMDSYRTFE